MSNPSIVCWKLAGPYYEVYTIGKAILEAAGQIGTIVIIHEWLDTGNPLYCTLAQVNEFEANGWELSCHSGTELLADLNEAELNALFTEDLAGLAADGIMAKGMSPGGGSYDELAYDVAKTYFEYVQKGSGGYQSFPANGSGGFGSGNDIHDVAGQTFSLDKDNAVSIYTDAIDYVVANGGILMLPVHRIAAIPVDANEVSTVNFQAVVDYMQPMIEDGRLINTTIRDAINNGDTTNYVVSAGGSNRSIKGSRLADGKGATVFNGTTPSTFILSGSTTKRVTTPDGIVGYVSGS